ncbi:MAG TPA: hypothetical protein VK169_14535 [Saprospiraceae bacterium]|nr:hypothetical protein [Saprospiraceae bacterium]
MKSITDNFNLSLLELLSVLLPGSTLILMMTHIDYINKLKLVVLPADESGIEYITYFSAAYFLGYIIYIFSSPIDELFDWLKKKAITEKSDDKGRIFVLNSKSWSRIFFSNLIDTYILINQILPYKNADLGYSEKDPINAYQYCYRRLMLEGFDIMFSEVERYQATAKFFRSMILVALIGVFLAKTPIMLSIAIGLTILSTKAYLSRWQKAMHVAFKNILVIEGVLKKRQIPNENIDTKIVT